MQPLIPHKLGGGWLQDPLGWAPLHRECTKRLTAVRPEPHCYHTTRPQRDETWEHSSPGAPFRQYKCSHEEQDPAGQSREEQNASGCSSLPTTVAPRPFPSLRRTAEMQDWEQPDLLFLGRRNGKG